MSIRNSLIAVVVLLAGLWGVAVLGPRAEGITSGTCIGGQEGICNAGAAIGGASGISSTHGSGAAGCNGTIDISNGCAQPMIGVL